jgi:hypothetical protein
MILFRGNGGGTLTQTLKSVKMTSRLSKRIWMRQPILALRGGDRYQPDAPARAPSALPSLARRVGMATADPDVSTALSLAFAKICWRTLRVSRPFDSNFRLTTKIQV